jgi:hypothetical protein
MVRVPGQFTPERGRHYIGAIRDDGYASETLEWRWFGFPPCATLISEGRKHVAEDGQEIAKERARRPERQHLAVQIGKALRAELGGTHRTVKTIMR